MRIGRSACFPYWPSENEDTGGEFKNERDDPLYTGLSKTEK